MRVTITQGKAAIARYLIVSCADGAFDSYVVQGLEEVRRKIAEEYYFGTYEEAQKDEVVSAVLKEFDDQENYWDWDQKTPTRWKGKGEQCYLEVILIRTTKDDMQHGGEDDVL